VDAVVAARKTQRIAARKQRAAARFAAELKRGKARMLTPEQLDHLIHHTQATSYEPERDYVIILLSYKAGLRAAEIAGLAWQDVTDATGCIGQAQRNALTGETEHYLEVPASIAKKGRARSIPMHPALRAALTALQTSLGPERTGPRHPVVQRRHLIKPTPLIPNSLVVYIKLLYERAGFRGCSSHSGRRTAITTLAQSANQFGCSLRDVQAFAGHQDLETTEIYLEDSPNRAKLVGSL
jgi:integrase/recombinase XerD